MKVYNLNKIRDKRALEVVQFRLKVIDFFERHGADVTRDAFGVARATVYLWRKKLKEAGFDARVLIPGSRAPIRRRQKEWHPEIVEYIKKRRWENPRLGQIPLKAELDEFCKRRNIKPPSASKIARIIRYLKDKGEIIDTKAKVSFYAKTGKIKIRKRKKRKKLRRKGYEPEEPGDLVQMDTIFVFDREIKRYIFSAIDVKSRFAFAYAYKNINSENAKDFMKKLLKLVPFKIKRVQTDNGSEFEGYFDKFLKKKKITHFYNYPKRPQSNSYIERFNRTLKEHFIEWQLNEIKNIDNFNKKLINYLIWYNTQKPHLSINKSPPLKYYIENFILNPKLSNMLWDSTNS